MFAEGQKSFKLALGGPELRCILVFELLSLTMQGKCVLALRQSRRQDLGFVR